MSDELTKALERAKEIDKGGGDKHSGAGDKSEKKLSVANQLVELAADADLFHDDSFDCFARVAVNQHHEIMRTGSRAFRRWLLRLFYIATQSSPGGEAVNAALNTLEAKAAFDGNCRPTSVRVAGGDGAVFVDLGRPDWAFVEITAEGWRIRNDAPVALHRPPGFKPLPEPVQGGDITLLREFLNVDDAGWILSIAWLVGAFRPKGPYPIATVQGEQGTGKSSFTRFLRSLVDPNVAGLRSIPKNEHDLVLAASNSWVVALDNISKTNVWLSDALCRLATGGGFSTKLLYSDRDESIFEFMRPQILNGIDSIVSRHDLADRCLFLMLKPIPDDQRRPEKDLSAAFDAAAPSILGGLFDAVAEALRNIDSVRLEKLPRMADFAEWVVAAEPALPWLPGQFEAVYADNRAGAVQQSIEASRLGSALLELSADIDFWEGSCGELLDRLEELVDEKATKEKAWPKSPAALSRQLRELASFMRRVGVDLDLDGRTASKRVIRITKTGG